MKTKQNYIIVPFKAETANGLKEFTGIAKFSSAGIIFEFEGKFLGLIGSDVKEIRVGLDEILDIKFRRGFFKLFARIQLRLKNYTKLSELPNDSGKIKLKIKREDFELAERAVAKMETILLSDGFDQLKKETKKQISPPQTSVNELFDTEKLETNDLNKTSKLK